MYFEQKLDTLFLESDIMLKILQLLTDEAITTNVKIEVMYLLEMLISFATPTDLSFFILGLKMFKYVNKFVETNSQSTTILDKYLN